jgi:branched-chain amino acid transport system ATP-binding protein
LALELLLRDVEAGYGAVRALHGVSVSISQGQTVALMGTNGNGKSTLMKCIMGIVRPTRGAVTLSLDGSSHDLTKLSTEQIVNLGVAMVPEGRRLFPKLTVEENLLLGAFRPLARPDINKNRAFCFEVFPMLAERRRQLDGSMSGGQQQMLAIARALMSAP